MKQFLVSYLVCVLILSPLNAIENVDTSERKKDINRVPGKKDLGKANQVPFVPVIEQQVEKTNKKIYSDQNFGQFKKVSLTDVVLESVANSQTLKSMKEKVNVAQYKLNGAIGDYYPSIDFEYKYNKYRATDLTNNAYKFYDERNYKFVLKQNIYAGGETSNNILNYKKKLDVEQNKYYVALEEVVSKAIKAYFNVVFAHRSVVVNERNMEKLNTILEIVQKKYDNGALAIGELTAIQASVSNAETKLVKVRSKLQESLKYYEYIAGEDFLETLPYEKNFNIDIQTYESLYERALEQNRNLMTYYKNIEADKYKLKKNEAQFAPNLDFQLSYDITRDKENFTAPEETVKGALSLTYNLFNGGVDKNKSLEIYSGIRDLNYRLAEEKRKLKWNIAKLHNSVVSTRDSISSKISEVISSRKMVEAYWEGFKLGEQDLQVLLQGQKQLNSAETDLVEHEQTNVTNFFTLINYTGDLLAFFNIDPVHPKFIDFSKSSYNSEIYIDDKFLAEEERLKREAKIAAEKKRINDLAAIATKDENIKAFAKKFMNSDDENYTVDIGTFDNMLDAEKFIKTNDFDKLSFPYDVVNGYELDTKVAYGSFENKQKAQEELALIQSKNVNKDLNVVKVSDIKRLYTDYLTGLEVVVEPTPPEVKVIEKIKTIEKIKQEKKKKEFALSDKFKNEFLSAPANYYTINISSFKTMKDIENLVEENQNIYDKSFAFNYINVTKLVRLMYGVYPTYEEAEADLESLGKINKNYHPVIENIGKEQAVYKEYEKLNIKPPEPKKEYEYVNITTKTEYKEPVVLKNSDKVEDEVLKEKVDKLLDTKEKKVESKKEMKLDEKTLDPTTNSSNTNLSVSTPTVVPVVVPVVIASDTKEEKEDDSLVVTSLNELDKYNNQEFKEEFLSSPRTYYTINIASLNKVERVGKFLDEYDLADKSFVFTVGENLDQIKVMYGVYEDRLKALEGVENLSPRLRKSNKPYIEKIFRKQDLYNKYHGSSLNEGEQTENSDDSKILKELYSIENSDKTSEKTEEMKKEAKAIENKEEEKIAKSSEVSDTDVDMNTTTPEVVPVVAPVLITDEENLESKDELEETKETENSIDDSIKSIDETKEIQSTRDDSKEELKEVKKETKSLENKSEEKALETSDSSETNIDVNIGTTPVVIPVVAPIIISDDSSNDTEKIAVDVNNEKEVNVVDDLNDVDKYNNQEFKKEFLNAQKDYYTINIATLNKVERVGKFLEFYGLEDKAFVFTVGKNLDQIKVMYGVYESRDKVLEAIGKLPERLRKSNNPYREKIFRKQNLYNTYHGNKNLEENNTTSSIETKKEALIKEEKIVKSEVSATNVDINATTTPVVIPVVAPVVIEDDETTKEVNSKTVVSEDIIEADINEEIDVEPTAEQIDNSIKETIVDKSDVDILEKASSIQSEKLDVIEDNKEESEISTKNFRVYVSTVSNSRVNWFIQRYSIDTSNLVKVENGNKVDLYLGDFESEEEAYKIKDSLHPRLTKTKVITLGAN